LRELTGQEIVEVRVPSDSPYVGVPLKNARLPLDSIVVSVRRGGRTIFPHGSTVLQAGDSVIANVAPGTSKAFVQELRTPSNHSQ
jgi:Trk K+ transport system NAD-binding subunit